MAIPLHFLDLPDDILLDILAHLPVHSVVLHCRRVCHKMSKLSRDRHLLIGFFNRTKPMLRQPIELEQLGTSVFDRSICQAETLERLWSDKEALGTAPRFWREMSRRGTAHHGSPVATMGDHIIFRQSHASSRQQRFTWVPVCDRNGAVVLQVTVGLCFPNIKTHMDLITGIFYIVYPSDCGLQVAGFGADSKADQPREVIRYPLPTRRGNVSPLDLRNGYLCLDYGRTHGDKVEIDILDLERGVLFQFTLPHLSSLLPSDVLYPTHSGPCVIAIETHLIYLSVTGRTAFAVFNRPPVDQGIQLLNTRSASSIQGPTYLTPALVGRFPFYLNRLWVMPRSATSFVIVGIRQVFSSDSNESTLTIHSFFFNVPEGEPPSFEEVGSLVVPGMLKSCALRSPPLTARYALGILSIFDTRGGPAEDAPGKFKRGHFALRVDLPDIEQGPESGNRCQITLTRIHLAPAVDEQKETAEFEFFDHFTGKVVLLVSSDTILGTSVVFDYLSRNHVTH